MLLVVIIICVNLPHSPQATCYGGSTMFFSAAVAASYFIVSRHRRSTIVAQMWCKNSATTCHNELVQ